MYKNLPPIVAQKKNQMHCWAASLESWLAATNGRTRQKQSDLVDWYGDASNGGAIDEWTFEAPADDFTMGYEKMKGGSLTIDYLNDKLKKGHLWLMYNLGGSVAHAVVVYGVGYPTGGKTPMLSVMDPWTGAYRNIELSYFSGRPKIVSWPN